MTVSFESKLKKYFKNIEIMKTPSCLDTDTIGFYIENKLPKGEKIRVEKHITSCLYCLDQLAELRELIHFQKHKASLPAHILHKIVGLYPKEKRPIKEFVRDIFTSSVQKVTDLFTFPIRQWRYATVSMATALAVILIMIIYRGFTPDQPFDIEKIQQPRTFTMLHLREVKNPIILLTGDIDNTFEKVRRLIQAHNGKMLEAIWVEKGIKLIFTLKKEEETFLFDDFSKLGEVIVKEEGYRDKKGNVVVLLKER